MVTRIRELLEIRQLSPTQFADLIGVGRPVISHILSERNKPSLEVVQKVISAFPEVSLPWLLSGVGTMLAPALSTALPAATAPIGASPALPPSSPAVSPPAIAPAAAIPASPAIQQAPPPLARPLPPKFRPAAQVSARFLPDAAAAQATELVAAPGLAAPTLPTPPTLVAQPVAPAELPPAPPALADPLILSPAQVQSLPTPAALPPVTETLAAVPTATPNAVLPAEPANDAAALSFLGEPGKAIRRIVIFYRDGSFSDYVPEGQ